MEEPKLIENINLKNEITDNGKYFRIGYSEELGEYILAVTISWIAWYDRYYLILKEDYELYKENKDAFYERFENELSAQPEKCFKERFIGAAALRDYDCAQDTNNLPTGTEATNPFQHYFWWNKILWARILYNGKYYLVPPMRAEKLENGQVRFFIREMNFPCAKMFYKGENGNIPAFYGISLDELKNI